MNVLSLINACKRVFQKKEGISATTSRRPGRSWKRPQYRFALEDMRCPICRGQPHENMTNDLSERARLDGMMACQVHGPVKAEIVLSIPEELRLKRPGLQPEDKYRG